MLELRLMGGLEVAVDGEPLPAPQSRRGRELLAFLALHPGPQPRGELAARFWPDVLDASARASLRTALHDVRRALGERGGRHLAATRERVELGDGPDVWVDARAFTALVGEARLDEALALWRGELLPGVDAEWVVALRDEYRERFGQACERLARAAEQAGDREAALRHTRAQVRLDPLSEQATRRLVGRLAAAGDRPAALAAYARLEDRLRRELGVAPSAPTRRLVEEVRGARSPAPAVPPPAAGSPPPAERLPPALARRVATPFVGRRLELERLRALLAQAAAGERSLALVGGEAGIGKTRLVAELARIAHAGGAQVLYGRCDEEPLGPYQPFAEALAAQAGEELAPLYGPGGADAGGADVARPRLFQAVGDALARAAARRTVLLVLDDLHWAGDATLLLLRHLARAGDPARLLVVGTFRPGELVPGHPLAAALADLRRERSGERIALAGLGEEELGELLGAWVGPRAPAGLARALHADTEGNPFFAEEVVRHLDERGALGRPPGHLGVPDGVREVIARRVERLGEEAGHVLAAAAVAGRRFDLAVLEGVDALAGVDVLAVLERAVRGELVREEPDRPGRHAFAHALVRDTLYDSLSAARRTRLHRAVAAAIERRHAADPGPVLGELAHHHLRAAALEGPDAAVEYAARAAERAVAQLAYEEAARHLGGALALLPAGDPRRGGLLAALGEARLRAGQRTTARRAFLEAAELARAAGDARLLARAALGHSGLGVTIIAVDEPAVALLREALAALGEGAGDDALRARLLARLAVETYYAVGPSERKALGDRAVALARRGPDRRALVAALEARRVALWSPAYLSERLATAREMLAVAEEAGDVEGILAARSWLVVDLGERGDLAAMRREIDAHAALADELRLPSLAWWAPLWRSTLALLEGRFADARALIGEVAALGRRAREPNAELYAELQAIQVLADLERYEEISIAPLERELDRPAGYAYRAGYAWTLAARGDHDRARELVGWLAHDGFARLGDDANRLAALVEIANALAQLRERRHAGAVHALLAPYADRNVLNARGAAGYGSAEYHLGLLAVLMGDGDAAADHFERALAANAALGARPWVARTRLAYGELLRHHGDHARGGELVARAGDEARALGIDRLAARAAAAAAVSLA